MKRCSKPVALTDDEFKALLARLPDLNLNVIWQAAYDAAMVQGQDAEADDQQTTTNGH